MKTYTFKIKLFYPGDSHPVVLSVVHCPLEVLFDSLKEVPQFEELYKTIQEESSGSRPAMYITASDYVINNSDEYVNEDFCLCMYNAVLETKSLAEFLAHPDYFDFVDNLSTTKSEKDLFYKENKEDEV